MEVQSVKSRLRRDEMRRSRSPSSVRRLQPDRTSLFSRGSRGTGRGGEPEPALWWEREAEEDGEIGGGGRRKGAGEDEGVRVGAERESCCI